MRSYTLIKMASSNSDNDNNHAALYAGGALAAGGAIPYYLESKANSDLEAAKDRLKTYKETPGKLKEQLKKLPEAKEKELKAIQEAYGEPGMFTRAKDFVVSKVKGEEPLYGGYGDSIKSVKENYNNQEKELRKKLIEHNLPDNNIEVKEADLRKNLAKLVEERKGLKTVGLAGMGAGAALGAGDLLYHALKEGNPTNSQH